LFPPSLRFRRVFIDSSAQAALLDQDDANHGRAIAILDRIAGAHFRLVITNVVLIEAHALIVSLLGADRARRFVAGIRAGNTLIVRVRASDEARAEEILFRYTDKAWSYADATSFVVMERLGIQYAFTFDSDFAQYGFTVLTPDTPLP
jgi:predicted nucleic acid-binding protein